MISSYKNVIKAEDVKVVQPRNNKGMQQPGVYRGASADGQDALAQKNKIEAIKNAAYKSGFADGSKEGRSDAQKRHAHAYAACEKLMGELKAAKRDLWKNSEKDILELAFAVAEKVIQREVSRDKDIVSAVLTKAIDHIQDKEEMRIRINPVDHTQLMEIKSEASGSAVVPENVYFEKDERITRGGAVVETRSVMVDARVDQQLQALMEALIS
jgi:flagellar assembly protein FliH